MKFRDRAAIPLAAGWFFIVVACLLAAAGRGIRFDSSILALLPETGQTPQLQLAGDRIGEEFSSRLLLLVSAETEPLARAAVAALAAKLEPLPQVAGVTWRIEADRPQRLRGELRPYRFVLLDDGVRQMLLQRQYDRLERQALVKLFGPLSGGGSDIVDDPFGLFSEFERNRAGMLKVEVADSMLRASASAKPAYLLSLELAQDPFSPAVQNAVLGPIEAERQRHAGTVELQLSGMLIHAAAGARQAQTEMSTIGLGSLLGIALAVLWIFRRPRPLALMLLPVAVGCGFAAAVTLLVFGRIHLVTLAFGAGLVGVSIDYALHFLAERRYSDADRVLPKIIGGLALGLFSSLMAYAVMILTPFPGLRQMASFSVAGLFGAWITVVLWFPRLTRGGETGPIALAQDLAALRQRLPRLENNRLLQAVLALAALSALVLVGGSAGRDDVRLLQTSPADLLAQEKAVHQTLGTASSSQYLLLSAADLEQCLRLEEDLAPALQALIADGRLQGYRALSTFLPSLERQAQNYTLVEELYRERLESFYRGLGLPREKLAEARRRFDSAAGRRLTPERWRQLAASESLRGFVIDGSQAGIMTVIRFTGLLDAGASADIQRLADSLPGLYFVDQVESVSQLMKKYRGQIGKWLIVAYFAVLLVLALRYRRRLWRLVLPPLLASLLTLAIIAQIEQGINLFHLLALILVLGIGLDMGIFMAETNESEQTWLAVSLSTYTSLLAFGLLALSRTPVLHHFGLTVAIGLSLVWLLSQTVRSGRTG